MSLDRRLREGVDRLTADLDPDVERHLHMSIRGARRRIRVRRTAIAIGAVASIAAVALLGPRLLGVLDAGPRPADRPGVIGPSTLAGIYTVDVDAGPAVEEANRLAGEWTIELRADGTVHVTAPPAFTGSLEGYSFDVEGDRFRTDAFINDLCNVAQGLGRPLGVYRWEIVGDTLVLQPLDDACEGRIAIFGGLLRPTG